MAVYRVRNLSQDLSANILQASSPQRHLYFIELSKATVLGDMSQNKKVFVIASQLTHTMIAIQHIILRLLF